MVTPDFRDFKYSSELYHYGMPRRSGRYPYGSGDRPYQSLSRRIGSSVKKTYEKAKPVVKKAAKAGVRVAANMAISTALGEVGGIVVYEALKSKTVAYTTEALFNQMAKNIEAANAAKKAGALISASTYGTLHTIGRMKVGNKQNNERTKNENNQKKDK